MKQYKIVGTIDLGVTESDGTKKHVATVKNQISFAWLSRLGQNLIEDRDMIMNNLFGANTQYPVDGEDGIAFYDTDGLSYSMITTKAHPTANTVVFTGTFTGTAVIMNSLVLGLGWINQGTIHGFFSSIGEGGFTIAQSAGTTWDNLSTAQKTFTAVQAVTIVWTVEVIAY